MKKFIAQLVLIIAGFMVHSEQVIAQNKYKIEAEIEYYATCGNGYNLSVHLVNTPHTVNGPGLFSYNVGGGASDVEVDGVVSVSEIRDFPSVYSSVNRRITHNIFDPGDICSPGGLGGSTQPGDFTLNRGCFTNPQKIEMFPNALVPQFEVYRIRSFADENDYNAGSNNLFDCETKILQITDDISCNGAMITYGVQYQLDGGTWQNLLPYRRNSHPFTINMSDFPGLDFNNTIRLRIQYTNTPGPDQYSDILTYVYKRCSPGLNSVVPSQTQCSYTEDGGFSINFNRALNSGERINFSLEQNIGGNVISMPAPSNVFYSGTSYVWPNGLAPGSYNLEYQSAPDGSVVQHGPIIITSPTAVSFSASGNDVLCFGASTGSIQLNASGGAGSYQYRLNNGTWLNFSGANAHTVQNLSAGSYQVEVRDGNQCTEVNASLIPKVLNVQIDQPSMGITISGSATPATGFGLSNGSINISVSGGVPPYSYAWSNGATTQDISGLSSGNYSVTVTDQTSCDNSRSFFVSQPPPLTTSVSELQDIDCFGDNTGSLRANPNGGVAPYTYSWTKTEDPAFSRTGRTISGLTAGRYNVRVRDRNGNLVFGSRTLTQPTQIQYSVVSTTDILCFGDLTGAIDITILGGAPPYTINWSDGATTVDRVNLGGGDYTFEITDATGCSVNNLSDPITVIQPDNPITVTIPTNGVQDPTVHGATNGSIDIEVSGGTPGYSYNWNTGATTQDLSNLGGGNYQVTITDGNGCTDIQSFTLVEPPPLIVDVQTDREISCNGGFGDLTSSASGGVPIPTVNYQYEWYVVNGKSQFPIGIHTPDARNLRSGTYRLVITDANGNQSSDDHTLTEPTPLIFSDTDFVNVSCHGGNDGSAEVTVSGGTPGYDYEWTKTGDAGFASKASTIEDLPAGEYNVKVTDKNGCDISRSFHVEQPDLPVSIILDELIDVGINGQSTGIIDINVTGGTPGYTYQWTRTGDPTFQETNQDLNSLPAGEYRVEVRDTSFASTSANSGCIAVQVYTITQPPPLVAGISETNSILCKDDGDGQLLASAIGGVGGYMYEWFRVDSVTIVPLNITIETLNDLSGGEYEVQVTDANGAFDTERLLLHEPEQLEIMLADLVNVSCFGESNGSIDIVVTGGTGTYYYDWFRDGAGLALHTQDLSNLTAADYEVSVIDDNGCDTAFGPITTTQPAAALSITDFEVIDLSGFQTGDGTISVTVGGGTTPYNYEWRAAGTTTVIGDSSAIADLQVGVYELTIIDHEDCTVVDSFQVNEPGLLEITDILETDPISCFGDSSADLEGLVQGGVPPYQLQWYEMSDDQNILSTTAHLMNVPAGTYVLSVQDANSITTTRNYQVLEPQQLQAFAEPTHITCDAYADGEIDLTVAGGIAPYSFFWSNGANTEDLNDLIAGNYSVTIRDQNLCEVVVDVSLSEPQALSISELNITNVSIDGLSDGSIEVTAAGGNLPYTFEWRDQASNVLSSTTNHLENISAGEYALTVTDNNQCILGPITYQVTEPGPLAVMINEEPIDCFGGNGQLTAVTSGGVSPYSYEWYDTHNTLISVSESTGSIPTGTYQVVVTDASSSVEILENLVLDEPEELEILSIDITPVSCYGGIDGAVEVTVVGGTGDYLFQWNTGVTGTSKLTDLAAGDYSVVITDENGCDVTSTIATISQPPVYDIQSVNLMRPSGNGTPDGSIEVTLVGGAPPYQYEWSDSLGTTLKSVNIASRTDVLSGVPEGQYAIAITDSIGCSLNGNYNLAEPDTLVISIEQIGEVSCHGGSDGSLEVITMGGVGGNSYQWFNASNNAEIGTAQVLAGVSAGEYYVIVRNADGLSEQSSIFTVSEPTPVEGNVNSVSTTCNGFSDGAFVISANGGSGQYEFRYRVEGQEYSSWQSMVNGAEVSGLPSDDYEVQLRDLNGCFYEGNGTAGVLPVSVPEPDELTIHQQTIVDPSGSETYDGSIEVTISGGSEPYGYQWTDVDGNLLTASNLLSDLSIGNYFLTVSDASGCQLNETFTLAEASDFTVSIEQINVILCSGNSGASLKAVVEGGNGTYAYQWFETGDANAIGATELLESLPAGTYYVVVTNQLGDSMTSQEFEIEEPATLTLEFNTDYELCGNGNDWQVTAEVTGGTAPYTYRWSNGMTTPSFEDILPGNYELLVTDNDGCTIERPLEIIAPPSLQLTETINTPSCIGESDGSILLDITGGAAPYMVIWQDGDTSVNHTNLSAGNYQVTVTDARGCVIINDFEVSDPELVAVDLGETVTLCIDQTKTLDATIGAGATYLWSADNGYTSTQPVIEVSEAGLYSVVATSAQGCVATDEISIVTSDEQIDAEFAVTSQVFAGEEFLMVDISDPIPETVTWVLPLEMVILEQTVILAEGYFDAIGEYDITMVTTMGACRASSTKQVIVVENESFGEEDMPAQPAIVVDYDIFPNPSAGSFTITATLDDPEPISIKIFSLLTNHLITHRTLTGQTEYEELFELQLTSGVYMVLLETANSTQLRKIIVE